MPQGPLRRKLRGLPLSQSPCWPGVLKKKPKKQKQEKAGALGQKHVDSIKSDGMGLCFACCRDGTHDPVTVARFSGSRFSEMNRELFEAARDGMFKRQTEALKTRHRVASQNPRPQSASFVATRHRRRCDLLGRCCALRAQFLQKWKEVDLNLQLASTHFSAAACGHVETSEW